jgi:hypothetical protein
MMHSIEDIQTKRRGLDHHIRRALVYANKKDFDNVRLMFSQAEQEMRYLEHEVMAASGANEVE